MGDILVTILMPTRKTKSKAKVKTLPFVTLLEVGLILAILSLVIGTIFLMLAP